MWCSSFAIPSSSPTMPAERCSVLPISAKLSRRRNPPSNGGDNSTADAPLGHAVLSPLKSNSPSDQRRNSSIKISNPKEQQRSSALSERGLSGSDVLFALQRATTQKTKKKRRENHHSSPSNNRGRGRTLSEKEGEEDASDYISVRPLCLKSDWGTRLDELEKRLLELTETAAA